VRKTLFQSSCEKVSEDDQPTISIVIPTLDEEGSIGRTLDAIAVFSTRFEVIVVDGGSSDKTIEIARERGAKLIVSERGRGTQMHAGSCAARGKVLWFLHADTLPPADAIELILESLSNEKVVGGSFDVRFDGRRFSAHFLCWFYRLLRRFGICYADAAIFVRREVYELTGGFKPFPIFEDLDLVGRLRRVGQVARVASAVTTSSRRFESRSFFLTFAGWTFLQLLYWAGVDPKTLGKLYAPIR